MEDPSCSLCGGRVDDDKDPKFFECLRCARREHSHCNNNEGDLCDLCREDDRKTPLPLEWLRRLASCDFRRICRPYSFCYFCSKHFCPRCCPPLPPTRWRDHGNHPTFMIDVSQHGELLLVRLEDVNNFYDCSRVEPEAENPGWVRLHPKPEQDAAAGGGGEKPCGFRDCNRRIAQGYDFCSVYCQSKEDPICEEIQDSKEVKLTKRNQEYLVVGLLKLKDSAKRPIFSLGHRWDEFCLLCHAGFNSRVCHHHGAHRTIPIREAEEGGLVARFTQSIHGRWLASLSTVQSSRQETPPGLYGEIDVIVEVPLMQPQPDPETRPNACPCGNGIDEDMEHCSVHCMVNVDHL